MCATDWSRSAVDGAADYECVMTVPGRSSLSPSGVRATQTGLFPLSVRGMNHSADSKNRQEERARAQRQRRDKRAVDTRKEEGSEL